VKEGILGNINDNANIIVSRLSHFFPLFLIFYFNFFFFLSFFPFIWTLFIRHIDRHLSRVVAVCLARNFFVIIGTLLRCFIRKEKEEKRKEKERERERERERECHKKEKEMYSLR